jgi:hypothetical protein
VSVVSLRRHTDAVIALLESAGLTVGDAEAQGLTPPYVTVYSIPGGRVFGTLANPHEDAEIVYQTTCVGTTREQAEWLVDKSTALLNGFSVAGREITFVDMDGFPGVRRDDDASPPVFVATPRFTVTSTPA